MRVGPSRQGGTHCCLFVLLGLSFVGALPVVFDDSPPAPAIRSTATAGVAWPTGTAHDAAVPEERFHKRRKKKKVICGIANLIAGRDAESARGLNGDQNVPGPEHRAARAAATSDALQDPRSLGVAGFLLGTVVGSQLGSGGFGFTQTQTQTQVQGPDPAPVSEDYDEVLDDGFSGGGGSSLCDQLQQRPEPSPLDSHFPLIHGLLAGGVSALAGGNQRPYRPPQRPQRPIYQQQQQSGLLYNYFKPWVGLFLK